MTRRLVVASEGNAQVMYVGYDDDAQPTGDVLQLEEARLLLMISAQQRGQLMFQQVVSTIGVARGGITIRVRPTMVYYPTAETLAEMEKQIKTCVEREQAMRAADAGLVVGRGRMP